MDRFVSNDYDHIEIIYNSFKNAATQIIKSEQFLPIPVKENKGSDNLDYIFEPSLKLTYNKARQASITNEILEIVGGAEALNS